MHCNLELSPSSSYEPATSLCRISERGNTYHSFSLTFFPLVLLCNAAGPTQMPVNNRTYMQLLLQITWIDKASGIAFSVLGSQVKYTAAGQIQCAGRRSSWAGNRTPPWYISSRETTSHNTPLSDELPGLVIYRMVLLHFL